MWRFSSVFIFNDGFLVVTDETGVLYRITFGSASDGVIEELPM